MNKLANWIFIYAMVMAFLSTIVHRPSTAFTPSTTSPIWAVDLFAPDDMALQ